MKKHLITKIGVVFLLFVSIFHLQAQEATSTEELQAEAIHQQKAILILGLIENYHYRKIPLKDSLSEVIFEEYIASLDGNHLYFIESDMKDFEKYRFQIDDDLKIGDLEAPYLIFNSFREKFIERTNWVLDALDNEYDFSLDEYYDADREEIPYAQSKEELDDVWRKIIKNQLLSLKLTGKEDTEAVDLLKKRYERYKKTLGQYKSEDVFEGFMNVVTESYDPHTSYFSPISSDNFSIDMKNSLEGIGAVLRMENDYTTIYEVRPGGPAFKSKILKKDDKVIAVAQGDDGEFEDVVGWRLDEVVQKIRGPKGSVVRLKILPVGASAGSPPVEVRMIREKITLEEQSASKKVIPVEKDGETYDIGIITIPSFYFDYEAYKKGEADYKSTSRDVAKLLKELETEEVDGVIIDLRYNGGGSLKEAIDLTGLFITSGPVVQVRQGDGKIYVESDKDQEQVYDGPMTVMVNRYSASASEIFAGAIQDYQRGIIVGEATYGKGTVQNIIDLSNYIQSEGENVGHINLTLAKFYRVTGSSTQHLGITPDIYMPSAYSQEEFGESSEPSALNWDEIKSANFKIYDNVPSELMVGLEDQFQMMLQNDEKLIEMQQEMEDIKVKMKDTKVSLNEEKRRAEMEEIEAKRKENKEEKDGEENPLDDPYIETSSEILIQLINTTS